MAASTRIIWPMWFAPGVIGSSQGRPCFTAPIRRRPFGKCAKSRQMPPQFAFDASTIVIFMLRNAIRYSLAVGALVMLLSSCGIRRHKYDNPIAKDTQQPDKVLFDSAIKEIEHSRFD